jgi:hypothetical protein
MVEQDINMPKQSALKSIIIFLLNPIIKLILWVEPSFKENSKVSYKRLSAFLILMTYTYSSITYNTSVKDPFYLLMGRVTDAIFFLLLSGIILYSQLQSTIETLKGKE